MEYKIVFSDVDGTLLNSSHLILPSTLAAIKELKRRNIEFVIVSARSPSGIYPILEFSNLTCPIICYSGALILDKNRTPLYSTGFCKSKGKKIIDYLENNNLDCTWNIYSMDTWIVKDRMDKRVKLEENIVHAKAINGNIDMLRDEAPIGKILCMCNPDHIFDIEQQLKNAFPELSIAKSSPTLLEIMADNVNKSTAVKRLCTILNISLENTIAFGDNYNDVEMLNTVATPFLMGNAPNELKSTFKNITSDNDNDGIAKALASLKLI